MLALIAICLDIGFGRRSSPWCAYAFLPILRNTMVGLQQVDPFLIEAGPRHGHVQPGGAPPDRAAARGPVMLAGIRTALMINVGTATLATFIGAGGLGVVIFSGMGLNRDRDPRHGAVLAAVLALFVDYLGGVAGAVLVPRGL